MARQPAWHLLDYIISQVLRALQSREHLHLGLIAPYDSPRIANPMYMEVVPNELATSIQLGLVLRPLSYLVVNGGRLT